MHRLNWLNVLLIDDSPTDRLLVCESLAQSGQVHVQEADSLESARGRLQAGRFDVALLDLMLPDAQGLSSLHSLQQYAPDLAIVILTGLADESIGLQAVEHGAQDCLVKGQVSPRELLRALRYACQRKDIEKKYRGMEHERQAAEDRLRQSTALQASVLNALPANIALLDRDGTIVAVNRAWEEFAVENSMQPPQCGVGVNYLSVCDRVSGPGAEDAAKAADGIRQVLRRELREFTLEYACHSLDQQRWFQLLAAPAGGEGENAAVVMHLDITPRRLAEIARREHAGLLENVERVGNIGFWRYRGEAEPLDWSPGTFRLFGLDANVRPTFELFRSMVLPEDRAALDSALARAEQDSVQLDLGYRIRRPDGRICWMHDCGTVEPAMAGRPEHRFGVVMDITASIEGAEALHRSEERFRLVSQATSDVLWDWNLVTDSLWWSPGMQTQFGYQAEELSQGMESWTARIHPEDCDRVVQGLHRALEARQQWWSEEYRFRRKDGTYSIIYDRGQIVRDTQGLAVRMVGGMTDITERKSLQAQLLQAQKMDAVGRLAGGVAHDFNNMLTVIVGYCELLLDSFPEDDDRRNIVSEIRRAAERAAALTGQLLAFSRKQILSPKIVDLNHIVSRSENMLRRLIGEDIAIRTSLQQSLPPVRVDPIQVEQILMNLASNARDAMPTGGVLTISTAMLSIVEHHPGTPPDARPGEHVCLSVADNGCGIGDEVLPHIFEPFYTTKESGRGTGLGLPTVFGIVKQSGGIIHVESTLGAGTTFRILLPAVEGSPDQELEVRSERIRGVGRILVVEDDDGVREIARLTLRSQGFEVYVASSGLDALQLLDRGLPQIDLLITDVVMPGLSGREFVERFRRLRPQVNVLFISGYMDDAVMRHGISEQQDWFLHKPFTPVQLALKVRELLRSRQ